jgi:short-subunit dehydrogenase
MIEMFTGFGVYSGTKAAVNWISEGLRFELAREKMPIRVTTIMPAPSPSRFLKSIENGAGPASINSKGAGAGAAW